MQKMKTPLSHGLNLTLFMILSFGVTRSLQSSRHNESLQAEGSNLAFSQSAFSFSGEPSLVPVLGREVTPPNSSGRPIRETADGPVYVDFEMHPFEVQHESEHHRWTRLDARTPELIDQLAHNDLERERLLRENEWVTKRELVYRNVTLLDQATAAAEEGREVTEIILPGFEGEEYLIKVDSFETQVSEDGVTEGWITGRLENDPDSLVSLGFFGEREAGNISSSELGVELTFQPREDQQIVVSQVDPQGIANAFGEQHCETDYSALTVGDPNAEL